MHQPKIVVLDGYSLNPGDLSWDALANLGDCQVYNRTPPTAVIERAAMAAVVLTNKTVLNREIIAALPALRYVGVLATGHNVVDLDATRARGIPVTNVPAYSTPSVAQITFAHILELTHRVGHHADTVRQGRWCQSPDFCYWDHPLVELAHLTLGIVGFGHIGQAVARIGLGFGMKVIVHSRRETPKNAEARFVSLEALFREADVVTLHCPLTEETRGLVNAKRLAWMKSSAFLINTSRGPLVMDDDLAAALNSGRLAGAGLDVLTTEPPQPGNPLLQARNCFITPHLAWATRAARARLMDTAVDNVRAFLAGQPKNVVNR